MTVPSILLTLIFTCIHCLFPPVWAGQTADTQMLVNGCLGCHGPRGISLGPAIPTISGMDEELFVKTMENYQKDKWYSTVMGRLAKGYTRADFQAMANYFSQFPFTRYPQATDPEKVLAGRLLHREHCEECHKNDGFSSQKQTGRLAGQWLLYLQYTLLDYQQGRREAPEKMRDRFKMLLEKQGPGSLEQLSHFYASQLDPPSEPDPSARPDLVIDSQNPASSQLPVPFPFSQRNVPPPSNGDFQPTTHPLLQPSLHPFEPPVIPSQQNALPLPNGDSQP